MKKTLLYKKGVKIVSKCKMAVNCILEVLQDGNIHQFIEFQEKAKKEKVINDYKDRAVPNALTWLKQNNPDFLQVKKGEYLLRSANIKNVDTEYSLDAFDQTVARLLLYIEELNRFNWTKCSDAEFKEARRKLEVLRNVDNSIREIE